MDVKCIGVELCGKCIGACPQQAISPGEKSRPAPDGEEITHVAIDPESCIDCGECAKVCPSGSLYMCGEDYSVDALMKVIRRDMPFYANTGGGVTVSGGECLRQPEFLRSLLEACKAEHIHTAVDTTGFADYSVIEPILPFTDVFLYDIKHIDSALHKRGTGVGNELILENAGKIAAGGGKFILRMPIIPRYNDTEEIIRETGRFIVSLGSAVEKVQLLPYHSLGTAKWKRLKRRAAQIFEAQPPSEEFVLAAKELLTEMGLNVIIH
jgi:pyruvate formate lyase activating enzyme